MKRSNLWKLNYFIMTCFIFGAVLIMEWKCVDFPKNTS